MIYEGEACRLPVVETTGYKMSPFQGRKRYDLWGGGVTPPGG